MKKAFVYSGILIWALLVVGALAFWYQETHTAEGSFCVQFWWKIKKEWTKIYQCRKFKWDEIPVAYKPVIYLYPEKPQEIKVQLDYQGELIADYPAYNKQLKGREVIASPEGTLINKADGKEYSYLFREGKPRENLNYDLSQGFVVKWSETRNFLQEKLTEIWLTPREYNEFIVYRYPRMKDNPYNLIHFAGESYTQTAPLTITPKEDSLLRVFMVFKALETPIEVEAQTFRPFERKGFTVIERGGTEL